MIHKDTQRLVSVLEAIEDGIYIVKDDYTVEFMNKAMVKNFGRGIGKKCHQVINRSDKTCPWCKAGEIFKGNSFRQELYIESTDKTFELIESPLENTDGTVSKLSIYRDISEAKKWEEELGVSEKNYKRLFEHVGCGVFISSKEGRFLDTNQALVDMLGYECKEDLLKIDITKNLYLRPQDRQEFQKMIERDGQVIDYEVDFKRKDGRTVPVLFTSHVRYDQQGNVLGYEGINVDQSQRKNMERQLREAHDFLNKIIQSSPDVIMAADIKGNIIIWNRAAEDIFGYKARDVIGKMNIETIYPKGMARKVMKMMRSSEYGPVGKLRNYPVVYVKQVGGTAEGNLSAALIYDASGKAIASVGIFVDLGERLEIERKLRHTQEQLLQAEKLAAMGRLTSQIAHEINNPLYGIMNTLELMKSEISPQSKRRKILEMALSETVRLSEMLRNMLSFSRPEDEQRQPTDINSIIDEILLLHEKQLREHSIRISSVLSDDLGKVYASTNQLRQVFLNMISNAKDAMPNGGTLSVRTKTEGDNVLIEISDSGTGIKKENLNKIFDAFFTTKDTMKDVGLGLFVCYGFIKDHGGNIRVDSEKGSGTTFAITLPVYKEATVENKT